MEAKLYDIAEPDALIELEAEIARIKKDIHRYIPKPKIKALHLPAAKKKQTRYIDPTYCTSVPIQVPVDVNDLTKGWKTLYPQGFCFNPIDYIPALPPKIFVFDPCDKKQVEYVTKNGKSSDIYIVANCMKYPFKDRRMVLPLTEQSKKQFQIEYVISVIDVDTVSKRIRIEEVSLNHSN